MIIRHFIGAMVVAGTLCSPVMAAKGEAKKKPARSAKAAKKAAVKRKIDDRNIQKMMRELKSVKKELQTIKKTYVKEASPMGKIVNSGIQGASIGSMFGTVGAGAGTTVGLALGALRLYVLPKIMHCLTARLKRQSKTKHAEEVEKSEDSTTESPESEESFSDDGTVAE